MKVLEGENIKAIIPLAGKGTRLRPHTYSKAKPLIHVAGKTVLAHIIDRINPLGVNEFIFIIGDMGDQIKDFVKENYKDHDLKATFIEQKELLGDGHAVSLAKDYVNEDIIIVFSDTIFEADLSNIKKTKNDGIMFVHETQDPKRFGIVTVKNNIVIEVEEKPEHPKSNLAAIGLYYFKDSRAVFDALDKVINHKKSSKGEYRIADALVIMLENGIKLEVGKVDEWLDTGKPETLLETNRILLSKYENNQKSIQGSIIIPPVWIGKNSKIENCIIGPNVSISDNVFLESSVIKNSIIDSNAKVKSCILSDSIIGSNSKVTDRFRRLNVGDSSEIHYE